MISQELEIPEFLNRNLLETMEKKLLFLSVLTSFPLIFCISTCSTLFGTSELSFWLVGSFGGLALTGLSDLSSFTSASAAAAGGAGATD